MGNNKNIIHLTETQLTEIINESVKQVLEEGTWDNIKAGVKGAFSGARRGYQGQQMVDRGTDNFKQTLGRDELAAQSNPWASKLDGTASEQANKAYRLYKEYQQEANKYLNLYKELIKKYDLVKDKPGQTKSKETSKFYGNGGMTASKNKFNSKVVGRDRTKDTNPTGLYGRNA